ncbi:MAG TPA: (deoxy)nucleoside triphosphate pyrophosphohydrolase [Draconibacterium sp.]|nr:(deoxy)nucleoside triphosphate pyrophosphohydrolase [Draconibacterium sp.]
MIEVTCALIIENNRVLIAQNNPDSDHAFKWEFPGGKIHSDENPQTCIIREIMEELEIRIRIEKELIPVEHDYGIKQIRLIPFICTIESGSVQLNEHLAFKWMNYGDLSNSDLSEADLRLIHIPANQKILKEYLGK